MSPGDARRLIVEALGAASGALDDPELSARLLDPSADVLLAELGLDSLDKVSVSMAIEERAGVDFDLADVSAATSVVELAAYVAQRSGC